MKILDLASPRFHKKERHDNENKKIDKGKSKIKRTQRSPKKMDSKSPRKKREKRKKWRKESPK